MRIVAFDTECTNMEGRYEVCLFSYVVADGDLNRADEGQIYVKANEPDDETSKFLKVDLDKVYHAPRYDEIYPQIRSVLDSADILLAHDAKKDLRYLFYMNEYYDMPQFEGTVLDTYWCAKRYEPSRMELGLENICRDWNIPLDHHNCVSDANACLEIVRHISAGTGMSFKEICTEYEGKNLQYTISGYNGRMYKQKQYFEYLDRYIEGIDFTVR